MVSVAFALVTAIAWGSSDFFGGVLSKRSHFLLVTIIGQAASMMLLTAILLWTRPALPSLAESLWAAAAGVGGGLGGLVLYRGLAQGSMAVVAPVSAVTAAAAPALVGLFAGESLSSLSTVGLTTAIPAIWLMSGGGFSWQDFRHTGRKQDWIDGIVSGLGFGLLYLGIERAGNATGAWPVSLAQGAGFLVSIALFVAWKGHRLARVPRLWLIAPWPSFLVTIGTYAFQLANASGLLAITAVVASLYPAVTVGMAHVILGEHTTHLQRVGFGLAATSVALIVLG